MIGFRCLLVLVCQLIPLFRQKEQPLAVLAPLFQQTAPFVRVEFFKLLLNAIILLQFLAPNLYFRLRFPIFLLSLLAQELRLKRLLRFLFQPALLEAENPGSNGRKLNLLQPLHIQVFLFELLLQHPAAALEFLKTAALPLNGAFQLLFSSDILF